VARQGIFRYTRAQIESAHCEDSMPVTCRFCLTPDLPDAAQKCRACGSWLDPARDTATADTVRLTVREELRADLKEHRAYLEGLLSQLKSVAALVVAAGLAATVYFGVRTDHSIADTAATIATTAGKQIEAAAEAVKAEAQAKVAAALNSPATTDMIAKVIADSVTAETARKMAAVSADIDARIAAATAGLDGIGAEIEALKLRSARALAELKPIEQSYSNARAQTVAASQSILPVQPVRVEEKGGLSQLKGILRDAPGALGFTQGHFYDGPVVWAYVDRLRQQPGFRDIVVSDSTDRFFGMFDAGALAAALDPPEAAQFRLVPNGGLSSAQLPPQDMVPAWSAFADALYQGNLGFVAGLPGFIPADRAVGSDWTSLRALDAMETQGADRLPVVDAEGRFVGVIERSRLTTRVLLEVAGGG
jgi:hypothetical protein